jgi:hypothetical protein
MREILTLREIEDFEKLLIAFIYDIQICSDNIEQILDMQNQGINLFPIKGFLGHYVYLCYSHCAINAFKIFHKDEKRSFQKLINKINNFSYDNELTNFLKINSTKEENENFIKNKSEFKALAVELDNLIKEKWGLISKFIERRHAFYAHHDSTKTVEPEALEDVKELREFSKKCFNYFYAKFKDATFLFDFNAASIANILDDRKLVDDYLSGIENQLK